MGGTCLPLYRESRRGSFVTWWQETSEAPSPTFHFFREVWSRLSSETEPWPYQLVAPNPLVALPAYLWFHCLALCVGFYAVASPAPWNPPDTPYPSAFDFVFAYFHYRNAFASSHLTLPHAPPTSNALGTSLETPTPSLRSVSCSVPLRSPWLHYSTPNVILCDRSVTSTKMGVRWGEARVFHRCVCST